MIYFLSKMLVNPETGKLKDLSPAQLKKMGFFFMSIFFIGVLLTQIYPDLKQLKIPKIVIVK